MPPTIGETPNKLTNILKSLQDGRMSCWTSVNSEGKVQGIVLTSFTYDDCSETKNLLVYCIASFNIGKVDDKAWFKGTKTLIEYAAGNGCHRIVGYTNSNQILRVVETLGGTSDYRLVTLDLKEALTNINDGG